MKNKNLHQYFIVVLLFGTIMISAAKKVEFGPVYRAILSTKNLITEIVTDTIKVRIVYPQIAQNKGYKKIVDSYLSKNIPEFRTFTDAQDKAKAQYRNDVDNILKPLEGKIFFLAVYSYQILDQPKSASIAFEVRTKTDDSPPNDQWYTLNIDKANSSIIDDETLFSHPLAATNKIINYAFKDIIRQREEKLLPEISTTFNPDENSNIETHSLSFVLLPSIRGDSYMGIRLYISNFNAPESSNLSYAVNIPLAILRPYLRKKMLIQFKKESVPFITRNLDRIRKFIYPDLDSLF